MRRWLQLHELENLTDLRFAEARDADEGPALFGFKDHRDRRGVRDEQKEKANPAHSMPQIKPEVQPPAKSRTRRSAGLLEDVDGGEDDDPHHVMPARMTLPGTNPAD